MVHSASENRMSICWAVEKQWALASPEFKPHGRPFPVTLAFPQIIGITRGSEAPLSDFLKLTLKTGLSYWDYIKIKSCTVKETVSKKAQYRMGEDICKLRIQ